MSPHTKRIISRGIGVYATPILQPTTLVAHFTTCLAIYAYHAASHSHHQRTCSSPPTPQTNLPSCPSPGRPPCN